MNFSSFSNPRFPGKVTSRQSITPVFQHFTPTMERLDVASPESSEEDLPSPLGTSSFPQPTKRKRVRKFITDPSLSRLRDDPFVRFASFLLTELRTFLCAVKAFFQQRGFPCTNAVAITLPQLGQLLVYILLLILGSRAGLNCPARIGSTLRNLTRISRFAGDSSIFSVGTTFMWPLSHRYFLYGQLFRASPANLSQLPRSDPARLRLNVSGAERGSYENERWFDIGTFDLGTVDLAVATHTAPFLLYSNAKAAVSRYNFTVEVIGNAEDFDTFMAVQFVNHSRFAWTMMIYRFSIMVFTVWVLLNVDTNSMIQNFVAIVTFFTYLPTGIALWISSSAWRWAFVLDALLADLFSLFLYNFWIICYSGVSGKFARAVIIAANLPIIAYVTLDSVGRSCREFEQPLEWLSSPDRGSGAGIVQLYTVLGFIAYGLLTIRKRPSDDFHIDLGTFAFFVAQIIHFLDEFALRARIASFMVMWKHLRILGEIAAAWLLTYEKTNLKWAQDAERADINYYEYEYEDEE
jgi:hypothetical protein